MELNNELEKLKSYFGTSNESDISKFKQQLKLLMDHFTSESEVNQINEFISSMSDEFMKKTEKDMEYIRFRVNLLENKDIIPMSFIAKNYFNKSKSCIYQRINENRVNGKSVKFSAEEINTFNFALKDISKKIGSISMPA